MANEIRLRRNNIAGVTTDNPLTNVATTINSPGFVDLPVVDATNHLILILDPLETNGPAEIVRVTAHTAAASAVTVVRGAEGSSARSHAAGTTWFHGPVTSDTTEVLTSSTRPAVPYTGQIIFETDTGLYKMYNGTTWIDFGERDGGAWTAWVPTWTNLTIGNASVIARFQKIGRTVNYYMQLVFGTTTTMGTDPRFSLPVTASSAYSFATPPPTGRLSILDAGTANFWGQAWLHSTTEVRMFGELVSGTHNGLQVISATAPFTWTTGDSISTTGTYESAA